MSSIRVLLALPIEPSVLEAAQRWLPDIPWGAPDSAGPPPWPSVEAALVANLDRVLPELEPSDLPNLRFVQHLFTGLDGFPFERFSPEVRVGGNVGGYAPFVAEHAVALVLALSKRLLSAHGQALAGQLRPIVPSRTLLGARALIVGFGEIGHEVARRLRPFGVTVVAVSHSGTPDSAADETYPASGLDDQIERADVIVDCLPLTRETNGIFGEREFSRFRDDVIFVNIGRAGTVDEPAFWAYLEAHPEARVGIDVWWKEDFAQGRLSGADRFAAYPNAIATPHTAAFTPLSRRRALDRAFENLARYFAGEPPRYVQSRDELRLETVR